jgi:signal transduction histidine kinase
VHRRSQTTGHIRWLVIGPFLAVVTLLAGLGVVTVDILASVRAYVGGESLWLKGAKDAVYHLGRYTVDRDLRDYRAFEQSLAVPLGDRRARLELERDTPDLAAARQALLEGGNHVDDIEGMVRLYRRFRHVDFMARAIAIWAEADEQILELRTLAARLNERIEAGDGGSPELAALLAQLPGLNTRLTRQGERFSATLGEASRQTRGLVLLVALALAGATAAGGIAVTFYLLRAHARGEQALYDSNERWALAAEAAGIGVFDWDLARDQVALDARAALLYGLPPGPATVPANHLSRETVHPEDAARLRSALREAIVNPVPAQIRYRVRHADGSEHHLELNAHARRGGGGVRMVGILRDVGDDVRSAQLQLDKQAAEHANRAKGEFLSRVSHELRTPLNAVLGFTELMQTDPTEPLTPVQAQRAQRVVDNGRQLLALIDDILDLGSLDDQAGAAVVVAPLRLAPVLRASTAHVAPAARAAGVELGGHAPGEDWMVLADEARLGQVLSCLLSNAVKYNQPGGEVRIDCSRDGEAVLVTVRDTGPGLAPEQLARLFQPFDRLGAEFSRVPGSGLGLVMARRLLDRMGGSLAVSSNVGVGTSAAVRLRAAPAAGVASGGERVPA